MLSGSEPPGEESPPSEANPIPAERRAAAGGRSAPSAKGWMPHAEGHQLAWMNKMIVIMWPNMRKLIISKVKDEFTSKLHAELVKRPKWMTVDDCNMEFDPGAKGPTIKAVRTLKRTKTHSEKHEYIELELDFEYVPEDFKMSPNLSLKLQGFSGRTLGIGVDGFEMRGMATVVLGPLTAEEPCFEAQQVFFMDPPNVKVTVTGLGALGSWGSRLVYMALKKTLESQMAEALVLPHRMISKARKDVPLDTLIDVKSPLPIGVLEIEVLEAKDLIALDVGIGSLKTSDPFVEVAIGHSKLRTTTVSRSLNPKWFDGPEYLLIYSLGQKVRIEAYDDDVLTEDDMLGYLPEYNVYDLSKKLENQPKGVWLDLTPPTSMSTDPKRAGRLKLRGRFLSIRALGDIDNASFEWRSEAKPTERAADYPEPPRLVTVKILGMEGERTKWFEGARATVAWAPANSKQQMVVSKSMVEAGLEGDRTEERKKGILEQASSAIRAKLNSASTLKTTMQMVSRAANLGFGEHEPGTPFTGRTSKAKVHHHTKAASGIKSSSALDPTVVRAIEQMLHREGWTEDRIAAMFGLTVQEVKIAAALRTNFEVVWHQAIQFIQPAQTKPYSGKVRIEVHVPSFQVNYAAAQIGKNTLAKSKREELYDAVAKNGLVGAVQLDLAKAVIGDDKPYCRRVRARLRRLGAGKSEDTEFQEGEGQCDPSVGGLVPGVLIEFCVEIRSITPAAMDQQVPPSRPSLPSGDSSDPPLRGGVELIRREEAARTSR